MSAPALRLRLPGRWWSIDLASDATVDASVRRIVRAGLGRRDDLASLRHEHGVALSGAARQASAAGATQFHVSADVGDGAVLAATIVEYRPATRFGATAEPAAVADALVRSFATASSANPWAEFEDAGGAAFAKEDALVLRRARPVAEDAAEGPAHVVEYWIARPGSRTAVLLVCSTALVDLAEAITELFDAVIAAAEWTDGHVALAHALRDEAARPA